MKKLALGFVLGLSVHFLMGAYASSNERELQQIRSEMRETNRHLSNMARSLDRIDDAFGSNGLKVQVAR